MRAGGAAAAALLLAAAAACAPPADQPPRIALGEDPCDHCWMIVSDERHAAAARAADGRAARFDDPGCLARFLAERHSEPWRAWGHDEELAWRPVEELVWMRSGPETTPMGSGLLGFATVETARARAPEAAGPLSWVEAAGAVSPAD